MSTKNSSDTIAVPHPTAPPQVAEFYFNIINTNHSPSSIAEVINAWPYPYAPACSCTACTGTRATGHGPNPLPSTLQPNTLTSASRFFLCLSSGRLRNLIPNIILTFPKFYLHFPCLEPRVFSSQPRSI